jgi:NitT/TauT family transport system substrate-binding protein
MTKIDTGLQNLWSHEWTRSDWTRRQSLDALAKGGLAALLASASASGGARAGAADDVVRIGYLPITDATALLVAHAKGYFEAEGLKVEKPTPVRSWSALVGAGRRWSRASPPASSTSCTC